jgi:hypothetical protein
MFLVRLSGAEDRPWPERKEAGYKYSTLWYVQAETSLPKVVDSEIPLQRRVVFPWFFIRVPIYRVRAMNRSKLFFKAPIFSKL